MEEQAQYNTVAVEKKYYVGIDPDCKASGVCLFNFKTKQVEHLAEMKFFYLYKFLFINKQKIKTVYLEAGWLNKHSNWHNKKFNKETNEWEEKPILVQNKISLDVGANHEIARKIEEMCIELKINYVLIRPYKKKIEINYVKQKLMWQGKLTQDMCDAYNLVYFR